MKFVVLKKYFFVFKLKIPSKDVPYTNWAPGQPNTVGPSYAYINLFDGLWYDEIGTATGHGPCEARNKSTALRGTVDDEIGWFSFLFAGVRILLTI